MDIHIDAQLINAALLLALIAVALAVTIILTHPQNALRLAAWLKAWTEACNSFQIAMRDGKREWGRRLGVVEPVPVPIPVVVTKIQWPAFLTVGRFRSRTNPRLHTQDPGA